MPLTELMNYFNEQLQLRARTRSLPATGFYKASNSFRARFGSLTFGSRFHSITTRDGQRLVGRDSETLVRSATGKELAVDEVYSALNDAEQVVQLDRLLRTLHSLNYLQQFQGDELLSLAVHPRHIASVSADYGKVFETILADCGLGPERVLLHTRLQDEVTLPHFNQALVGYLSRGYQIGVDVQGPEDFQLLEKLGLEPHAVFLHQHNPTGAFDVWPPAGKKLFPDARYIVVTEGPDTESRQTNFDGFLVRAAS